MDIVNYIISLDWQNLVSIALQAVGLAAIVATQTGNKSDDRIIQAIQDALNFIAGNWGKSKNR